MARQHAPHFSIRLGSAALLCALLISFQPHSALAVPLSTLEDPASWIAPPKGLPAGEIAEGANLELFTPKTSSQSEAQDGEVYALCFKAVVQFRNYGGTEVWGWHNPADNRDYAIMGIDTGVVFVNAATFQVCDTVKGPVTGCGTTRWREMKTYGHYCYVVSECTGLNQGLIVIDMQYLPDSVHFVGNFLTSSFGTVTSHTIAIDTVKGYAYLEGENLADRSLHVVNLGNPLSPVNVSSFGPSTGIHDMYAHNDTVWVAEGNGHAFSIYNLANKLAPALIQRVVIPFGGYVHNVWPTRDRKYCATTEEIPTGVPVKLWDVQDLQNIQSLGTYIATPGTTPHNAHFKDDTLYLSHYEAGVRVVSIANPLAPATIGGYDTYTSGQGPDYNGCWGVWPYSPNGYIYASNLDGRLFILKEIKATVHDTLVADTIVTPADRSVRVDVFATNSLDVYKFIIPITYSGSYGLVFDSISRVGCRTSYFQNVSQVIADPFSSQVAYELTSSTNFTAPDLAPGTGKILSLYFTVPSGASGPANSIDFSPINSTALGFVNRCGIAQYPEFQANGAVIVGSCCVTAGDADHDALVTIGDATFLISYIFSGGQPPICLEEADATGDAGVNIGDVTYLLAYIFQGGPAPICQ